MCACVGNQVAGLEDERKSKDSEIEKYKKYLSKAKKIIESFGDKNKTDENVEVSAITVIMALINWPLHMFGLFLLNNTFFVTVMKTADHLALFFHSRFRP